MNEFATNNEKILPQRVTTKFVTSKEVNEFATNNEKILPQRVTRRFITSNKQHVTSNFLTSNKQLVNLQRVTSELNGMVSLKPIFLQVSSPYYSETSTCLVLITLYLFLCHKAPRKKISSLVVRQKFLNRCTMSLFL